MPQNSTETHIRKMVSEIAGIAVDVPADSNLYLDLGVASVHAIQFLSNLEEHFGIAVPDEEFVDATSVAKLVAMVDGLLGPTGETHA
jgi:acyl carrier protein